MKVVIIGQKGLPAHSGGVERHVEDLAMRLAAVGHDVFVYCRTSYVPVHLRKSELNGIHCVYLPTLSTKHLETPLHTLFATMHALTMRPDIYHFQGIGPSIWAWIPRLLAPRAQVVSTFHCQDYFHQKWGSLAQAVFRVGEYFACTVTHQTIVVSHTLERYVLETYGRRATYIPNAVARPEKSSVDLIAPFGLTNGNYLLSVSRLVRHKGIHHIIRAYITALRTHALPPLVIVGDSSYTDEYVTSLKTLAKDHADTILFLGEQSGATLTALYRHARMFIQASESEGLSYTLLEAMNNGCPILASDIVENREVVPQGGVLFESGNVDDLAQKIRAILEGTLGTLRPWQYELHVRRYYNADAVFPQTLCLYDQITHTPIR